MVAVDQGGGRVRLGRLELRDLLGGELVGLEIREAPVRVAEVRPDLDRFPVLVDRLGAAAERLQRVGDRQMQVGRQRRFRVRVREHVGEAADAAFMIAEPDGRRGVQGAVVDVLRVEFQQPIELGDGLGVLVAVQQHAGVVAPQFDVVRGHLQGRGQQDLGIIEHLARDADAGQQPHRLDMIAVAQQERANELFGGREVAFAEQTGRGDDLWRKRFQLVRVRGGHLALRFVTDHLVEPLEHAPGGRAGRG